MRVRLDARFAFVLGLLGLSACQGGVRPVSDAEYNDPRYQSAVQGNLLGDEGLTLLGGSRKGNKNASAGDSGAALGVNAYLWRGALDTLSFMPLSSADPFGGVIITDWYEPPASPGERFKATAYILGRQLRADGVRVTIFRQVLEGGRWVDASVAPSTTGEIEAKVLERARELRAQTASS